MVNMSKEEKNKKPRVADFSSTDDMLRGVMSGKIDPMHLEVASKTKDFENFCFSAAKLMGISPLVVTSVGVNLFIHGIHEIAIHTLNKDVVEQTIDGVIEVIEHEKHEILAKIDGVNKTMPEDLEKKLREEFEMDRKKSKNN